MFTLATSENTGVTLTEPGSGPTRNSICLRLREKVRDVSHTALLDSAVGERQHGVSVLERRSQCLAPAAPSGLNGAGCLHVSASGPA